MKGDAPYASMKDLIGEIRKHPAVGIPYKGSGEITAALAGGQVQFVCSKLGAMLGQFQAGTLKALMTTTRQPLKELPNVPTARTLGWPEMERLAAWSALAGPRGLPPLGVVGRWTEVMAKLAHDPAWLAGVEKLGGIPAVRSPAETDEFVRDEYQLYEKLAERLGLRQ